MPSPADIDENRIKSLLRSQRSDTSSSYDLFASCSTTSLDRVFFISKMLSVPHSELPQNRRGPLTMEEIKARRLEIEQMKLKDSEASEQPKITEKQEVENSEEGKDIVFIAVGRVFSGTLKKGDKINAMGPKYVKGATDHIDEVELGSIYLLMGRDLLEVDAAPAGSIVGISGIKSQVIVNTGTLSSTTSIPAFAPIYQDSIPILRVAVEPQDLSDMNKLRQGTIFILPR